VTAAALARQRVSAGIDARGESSGQIECKRRRVRRLYRLPFGKDPARAPMCARAALADRHARGEIAAHLAEIGGRRRAAQDGAQQLGTGCISEGEERELTSISKDNPRRTRAAFPVDRPARGSRSRFPMTAPANGAAAATDERRLLPEAHEVECVYIPETDRGTLESPPSRLQMNCTLLPHRHAAVVRNSQRAKS